MCCAVFWYLWRWCQSKKLKLSDLFEIMRHTDMSQGDQSGGLTVAQVGSFLKQKNVPHTAAALRYFLQSLGLVKSGGKAATKLTYFKEFYEAFEANKPPNAKVEGALKRQGTTLSPAQKTKPRLLCGATTTF